MSVGDTELGATQMGYALRRNGAVVQIRSGGTLMSAAMLPDWIPAAARTDGKGGFQVFLRHKQNSQVVLWNLGPSGAISNGRVLSAGQVRLAESELVHDVNGNGVIGAGVAGIYTGTTTSISSGSTVGGYFAFIVRENGTGAGIGFEPSIQSAIGVPDAPVESGRFDTRSVEGDEIQGAVDGSTVSGSFRNELAGSSGTFEGFRKQDDGQYSGAAGAYQGRFSGFSNGTAYAILSADGEIFFYTIDDVTGGSGGGYGRVNFANNTFATVTSGGFTVSAFVNTNTQTITGSYFYRNQLLGSISLSLQLNQ